MGAAMLLRAVHISKHKWNATDEHLSSALQCAIDHVLNGAPCVYQRSWTCVIQNRLPVAFPVVHQTVQASVVVCVCCVEKVAYNSSSSHPSRVWVDDVSAMQLCVYIYTNYGTVCVCFVMLWLA